MTKAYVYKITRNDNLEYIGITVNYKNRIKTHSKSSRFLIGIKKYEILNECESYEEAEILEEFYIKKFNTYRNGLNLTMTGKGLNDGKFNTYGHIYSEDSKKKMSESAIKRGPNNIGVKHSDETKKRWSKNRKGKIYGPTKLTSQDWIDIYNTFINDTIDFDASFVYNFVKKTQRNNINDFKFSELKGGNGKPLTKETLYSNYLAEKYNVTQQLIRGIIKKNGIRAPFQSMKRFNNEI